LHTYILIAIVLQWAFTNYCNCVCANKILSIVYLKQIKHLWCNNWR